MIQRGQRLCLALETGEAVRVRGEGVRQHLDRDLAAQARVSGTVDRAHAAFADLGDDLVHTNARTGVKAKPLDYMNGPRAQTDYSP